jgi:nitroreductase
MDLFEAVAKRHSYRGAFLDRPVSREDLCRVVQAGLLAPSGCNKQTTTFVIVDSPDPLGKIQSLHPKNTAMQQARAYIACVTDANPEAAHEGLSFQVEDYSAAVENMLLAVTALGYATVWIDGWLRGEGRAEKIGEWLGLPEGKIVRVILPIGVPEDRAPKRPDKKPFAERAWFNRYGKNE